MQGTVFFLCPLPPTRCKRDGSDMVTLARSCSQIFFLSFFLFFFFLLFDHAHGIWKFPGQGPIKSKLKLLPMLQLRQHWILNPLSDSGNSCSQTCCRGQAYIEPHQKGSYQPHFSHRPPKPPAPSRTSPASSEQWSGGSQVTAARSGRGISLDHGKMHQSPANILQSRPISQSSLTAKTFLRPWSMSQPVKDQFDVYGPGWGTGLTRNKTAAVMPEASTEARAEALREWTQGGRAPLVLS